VIDLQCDVTRAAIALLLIGTSSCSWLYGVPGPPPRPWPPPGSPREEPCAVSYGRPLSDVLWTGLFGALAGVGLTATLNGDCDPGDDCWFDTIPELPATFTLVTLGLAVLTGLSAHHGFSRVGACRAYKSGAP
jgi:hypothetical protein